MSPPAPVSPFPDVTDIDPLSPAKASPVLTIMSPLTSDVPALSVLTVKLPELMPVLDPPSAVPPLPPLILSVPPAMLPAPEVNVIVTPFTV